MVIPSRNISALANIEGLGVAETNTKSCHTVRGARLLIVPATFELETKFRSDSMEASSIPFIARRVAHCSRSIASLPPRSVVLRYRSSSGKYPSAFFLDARFLFDFSTRTSPIKQVAGFLMEIPTPSLSMLTISPTVATAAAAA